MSLVLTLLRLVHILSAIFWVGTTLFMLFFLEPTIRSLGPDGSKFMQRLLGSTRFSVVIAAAGGITILAGLFLYWPLTNFRSAVIFGTRLPLTLGALAGILAGIVGTRMQGRSSGRLMELGQEMAAQNRPPSPEQLAEVQSLQATIRRGSQISAVLMVLAVIGMVW